MMPSYRMLAFLSDEAHVLRMVCRPWECLLARGLETHPKAFFT
jgi:hypothetical protein